MKKYFLIGLFITFAALTNTAKAQIFLGEAFVGLNICQVDGDQVMGYFKEGINAGVGVIAPVWKKTNSALSCRWKSFIIRKVQNKAASISTIK